MQQIALIFGGILGFISIVLGAFGSHLLKKKWSSDVLSSFEIGVKYQIYHALFLILIAKVLPNNTYSNLSILFTLVGVVLFSGSIYGICIFKSRNLPVKFLGPITPIGGLCLLLAWLFFTIGIL